MDSNRPVSPEDKCPLNVCQKKIQEICWRGSPTFIHPLTKATLILGRLVLHHVVLDQIVFKEKLQDANTTTVVITSHLCFTCAPACPARVGWTSTSQQASVARHLPPTTPISWAGGTNWTRAIISNKRTDVRRAGVRGYR